MARRREQPDLSRAFVALLGFALFSCAVAITLGPSASSSQGYAWLLVPAMALLAEFVPVEVSNRGVRFTFTLPYVAAMCAATGSLGAIATDVLVALVGGLVLVRRRRLRSSALWTSVNACVAAISAATGASAMALAQRWLAGVPAESALQALSFIVAYAVINLLIVTYLDSLTTGRAVSENVVSSLRLGWGAFALYGLVGMAVGVVVAKGLYAALPLTLVPVWALRTGLEYRARLQDHYDETITALTLMLQRAHPYTHGHLERVSYTAEEVARRLGLPGGKARLVRQAAVLHDIGKIAVDEEILDKPARLTDEELSHVRNHSLWGAQILAPVRQFSDLVPWILHHHERPDGTGYPNRLSDKDIPIESKIIAVVDAYDAMTGSEQPGQKRSYRESMTVEQAIAELERCAGTQFDPKVVAAFTEVVMGGSR
jgi:putative nucleotidyltransferase with HDIG domain